MLAAYAFAGEVVGTARFGQGHINDTFCVYTQTAEGDCVRYILQRMSAAAFKHPDQLMQNIVGVTDYLRDLIEKNGGDAARETMTVLRTKNGAAYFTDSEGGAWRVYPFVENTLCLQKAETPELFYASAKAFGNFQRMLKDYPADTLFETIEKFHDTENRLANFEKALAADKLGRAKDCAPEIAFVKAHAADCSVALEALRAGRLPLRVTHNDTKLNNILIDKDTGEGICVIDLDTVMPGLSINDFGDSIRFGANHSAEDERDLSKVNFDLPLFDIYTKGFLEGAAGTLTDAEKEYLPWGAKLMTLECGIRFLTDYLEGDTYFKIHRDGQNLDRCRTQFKLVRDMEARWDEMAAVVKKIFLSRFTQNKSADASKRPRFPVFFIAPRALCHTISYPIPASRASARACPSGVAAAHRSFNTATRAFRKAECSKTALLTTQMSVTTPQISMLSGAPPHSASASAGSAAQPNVGLSTMDTPSRTPVSYCDNEPYRPQPWLPLMQCATGRKRPSRVFR